MTNLGFPAVDQCQIRQTASAPLIGLPSDRRMVGVHPFHCVGEKYICAAVVGAEALPVLLPSLQPALDWAQMLDRLDGLIDRKSTRLNSSHYCAPRMPSPA